MSDVMSRVYARTPSPARENVRQIPYPCPNSTSSHSSLSSPAPLEGRAYVERGIQDRTRGADSPGSLLKRGRFCQSELTFWADFEGDREGISSFQVG